MRLCKDRDCLNFGIALNDAEFGRNAKFPDHLHIYCKPCCRRRTAEYREMLAILAVRTKVILPRRFPKGL